MGAALQLPLERAEPTWQHPITPVLRPKPGSGGSTHRHLAWAHRAPGGCGYQAGTQGARRQDPTPEPGVGGPRAPGPGGDHR